MSKYPPAWASGWGEDRYGEWLALTLGEATQRMRWIRRGRFLMGSPQDEPGRFGKGDREPGRFGSSQFEFRYEGPRHEVRLSRGYWLFDTPVTQALWVAVMGSNPSRFVDPKRPVERVSWDDAIEFLARINARTRDLDLVLPTEAQWEYGCRAGTETATFAGPLEILGLRNAPILDAIAWYGGNSGVGFELENGHDSWGWREQQYWHNRAGTHPVALKRPNAWGLYDMLGNVWEWCADDLRKYGSDAVQRSSRLVGQHRARAPRWLVERLRRRRVCREPRRERARRPVRRPRLPVCPRSAVSSSRQGKGGLWPSGSARSSHHPLGGSCKQVPAGGWREYLLADPNLKQPALRTNCSVPRPLRKIRQRRMSAITTTLPIAAAGRLAAQCSTPADRRTEGQDKPASYLSLWHCQTCSEAQTRSTSLSVAATDGACPQAS